VLNLSFKYFINGAPDGGSAAFVPPLLVTGDFTNVSAAVVIVRLRGLLQ
jgi:hypothetical protein